MSWDPEVSLEICALFQENGSLVDADVMREAARIALEDRLHRDPERSIQALRRAFPQLRWSEQREEVRQVLEREV